MTASDDSGRNRLAAVELDESIGSGLSADTDHERRVAIYDLIEDNRFTVIGHQSGPYRLALSAADGRIVFDIWSEREERFSMIGLSLSPFRRIVKDYFMICESYYKAIRTATPSQIETIDMARRGLHNEGSDLLKERLDGKIEIDSAHLAQAVHLAVRPALAWLGHRTEKCAAVFG